jgi:hypothetical protein
MTFALAAVQGVDAECVRLADSPSRLPAPVVVEPHGCHEYNILTKSRIYNDNDMLLFCFVPAVTSVYFSEPYQLTCLQPFFRMI